MSNQVVKEPINLRWFENAPGVPAFLADLDQRIAIADAAQRKTDELRRKQPHHNTGTNPKRKSA